ncbi:hypothetical protein LAC1533_1295 [Ligilactobacillus acidipiscis]|uniref:Uncharacterized protein n=1 Tax=Ligilactobacillus acidipiscis TaxID=89059 RepID=A0A1K1KPD2_9LACO|nr:hypothetical protein LAC1533_1295 [Ligilactobacillus acidipiscis]
MWAYTETSLAKNSQINKKTSNFDKFARFLGTLSNSVDGP